MTWWVTNTWTTVGKLLHATAGAACAVYKTCAYVFGDVGQRLDTGTS